MLHERRFDAAHAELADQLALLDRFPQVDVDPYEDEGFAKPFDPARTGAIGAPEPCLRPGLYDFALGNLVRPAAGGPPCLVDWEWVFEAAVPIAFVRFVVVRNSAEYLQPLLRALPSPRLPGRVPFDDVVVPEAWVEIAGLEPASVRRHLAWEAAFQSHLHVTHRPFAAYVVHDNPERVTTRRDENAELLVARLTAELERGRDRAIALEREVAERDAQLAGTGRGLGALRLRTGRLARRTATRLRAARRRR